MDDAGVSSNEGEGDRKNQFLCQLDMSFYDIVMQY